MKLNRVLVVFKKIKAPTRPAAAIDVACHRRSLETVKRTLRKMKVPFSLVEREKLSNLKAADLIVTVGGDGTFLAASHFSGEVPILGINSMPKHSVGFFCTAHAKDFGGFIKGILKGKLKARSLPTLAATIDGKPVPYSAVNDILFARPSPAETSRYTIRVGKMREGQKSSGVWTSTGAGSTAGIGSAGGRRMGLFSERMQYLIREPYLHGRSAPKLTGGILGTGAKITLIPHRDAAVFIDGPAIEYPVKEGSVLQITIGKRTVKAFLKSDS